MDREKHGVAAAFDFVADAYDEPPRRCFDMHAAALVQEAKVSEGAWVLDVATGTGKVALAAGRAVGLSGWVVGVDLSRGMLARARSKACELPVEFRVMDAEVLEFPDAVFDVVLCGFGVFFFSNKVLGIREMHRVLRPGGRVAFSSWTSEAFEPTNELSLTRMERYGIPRPPSHSQAWMTLTKSEHLLVLLEKGGFRQGRVLQESTGYFIEAEDWWTFLMGTSAWAKLSRLSRESLRHFRRETLEEVAHLRTDRGIWLDASALICVGVRTE